MASVLKKLALTLFLAFTFRACTVETFRVSGTAMLPAIVPGDIIVASKVNYGLRLPGSGSVVWRWGNVERGDLVVLGGVGEPPVTIVRRVAAIEGDQIRVANGRLSRKVGEEWVEAACEPVAEVADYCRERLDDGRTVLVRLPSKPDASPPAERTLGMGEIFVLGDDRQDGPDGRFFGPVAVEMIIGKAVRVWMPARAQPGEFAVDKVLPVKINERGYFTPLL